LHPGAAGGGAPIGPKFKARVDAVLYHADELELQLALELADAQEDLL
jgi:hypothetical protein